MCRGTVYFIRSICGGPVKIGFTSISAKERLAAAQTYHPEPLVIAAETAGTSAEEAMLHKLFADHRLTGEWFNSCDRLMELVHSLHEGISLREYLQACDL